MTILPWWQWLTLGPKELRELGADPAERENHVGHLRKLSRRWAGTVGHWGIDEPRALICMAGLNPKVEQHRFKYNNFRHRWKLKTARQMSDEVLEHPEVSPWVALAECAATEFYDARHGNQPYMKKHTIGEAFREAGRSIGILPVEVMLYSTGLYEVLNHFGITLEEYEDISRRGELWSEAGIKTVLPSELLEEYLEGVEDERRRRVLP